jgi:hypothetical protein
MPSDASTADGKNDTRCAAMLTEPGLVQIAGRERPTSASVLLHRKRFRDPGTKIQKERRPFMISISRSLARQIRSVFRRLSRRSASPFRPIVSFEAGRDGLRIRSYNAEVAGEVHVPSEFPPETLAFSLDALTDFEGRGEGVVSLERRESRAAARWDDEGIPRLMEYDLQDPAGLPAFPQYPAQLSTNEPGLLKALADGTQIASQNPVRYAVDHLQLRGKFGDVVATDGCQLLIQSGFTFLWEEEVLVPALSVFGCRELPDDVPVAIGKTDTHVAIRIDQWTLFLPINKEGRYPQVDLAIPKLTGNDTCWLVEATDAAFLQRAIKRLPGGDDANSAITLDLNGQAAIRARAEGQSHAAEVFAGRSTVAGPPVRMHCNRAHLARALQLGFSELTVIKPDVPTICRDERRKYVFMPLAKESAIPPNGNGSPTTSHQSRSETTTPTDERTSSVMANSEINGNGQPEQVGSSIGALIAEGESLRGMLREAYVRTGKLLAAIKRHKKQAQVVQSTLASLRQLERADG